MKKAILALALLGSMGAAWAETTLPANLDKRAGEPYVDAENAAPTPGCTADGCTIDAAAPVSG